jgi:hypothetical protein
VQIVNVGMPGCSASTQGMIKVLAWIEKVGTPCSAGAHALFDQWRKWVDAYNPDVVLYVARGETFNQTVGGQWENLGQPSFDAYVSQRLRDAVSVLGAKGATVVLGTTPYYDSGESPAGSTWPEDAPSRVQIDNATIRAVSTSTKSGSGNQVYVFDLNQVVSPHGKFSATVGGVNVRCADGVHFSRSGGIFVGERLLPDLVTLGQAHAVSSPGGGGWTGPLPPATPEWYTQLPCQ